MWVCWNSDPLSAVPSKHWGAGQVSTDQQCLIGNADRLHTEALQNVRNQSTVLTGNADSGYAKAAEALSTVPL